MEQDSDKLLNWKSIENPMEKWIALREVFDWVMNSSEKISCNNFVSAYNLVLSYCQNEDDMQDLYTKVEFFIIDFCEQIKRNGPFDAVEYLKRFNSFLFSARTVDGICNFLNRYWICQKNSDTPGLFKSVYDLAIHKWSTIVIPALIQEMTESILMMVNAYRTQNVSSEDSHLRALVLHLSVHCEQVGGLSWFDAKVLPRIITQTFSFYDCLLANVPLDDDDKVMNYLYKLQEWVLNETVFLNQNLTSYVNAIMTVLSHACIWSKFLEIQKTFTSLLERFEKETFTFGSDEWDELKQKFSLLYCTVFNAEINGYYFKSVGHTDSYHPAYQTVKMESSFYTLPFETPALFKLFGASVLAEGKKIQPNNLIEGLIQLYEKYSLLITRSFMSDLKFKKELECVFGDLIIFFPDVCRSLPFYLSRCFKMLFQKKISFHAFELYLHTSLNILRYLSNHDYFQDIHLKLLAFRLIKTGPTKFNFEAENCLLCKLKYILSPVYTNRMHTMIQDMLRSENSPTDIGSFSILSSVIWPLRPFEKELDSFTLPPELAVEVDKFSEYYHSKHHSVKIKWLHSLSKGEVVTSCFSKKYSFNVSLVQMTILLQFNTMLAVPVVEMAKTINLSLDCLKEILNHLVEKRILIWIEPESLIGLNLSFYDSSNVLSINNYTPMKNMMHQQIKKQPAEIDFEESSFWNIQAVIVRILKAQTTLTYNELKDEIGLRITRFKPTTEMIKASFLYNFFFY
jgi:hypothetical protein